MKPIEPRHAAMAIALLLSACGGESLKDLQVGTLRLVKSFNSGGVQKIINSSPVSSGFAVFNAPTGCIQACDKLLECGAKLDKAACESLCKGAGTEAQTACFRQNQCETVCGACIPCEDVETLKGDRALSNQEDCKTACSKLRACNAYAETSIKQADCELACSLSDGDIAAFARAVNDSSCAVLIGQK